MAALLEVEGLKAYYGQTQALHDVSFSLDAGGITTVLGANGSQDSGTAVPQTDPQRNGEKRKVEVA